jgi:hypothetical protein
MFNLTRIAKRAAFALPIVAWSLVPIAVAAGPGAPTCGDDADAWLLKSMRRSFSSHVTAVIIQRDPAGEDQHQTVRVERSKDGKVHHVVTQPLRRQGTESVDDGKRLRVYLPDQNVMIDQASPHLQEDDAEARWKLAKKNYDLKFGTSVKIAGRDTHCIVASPHDDRMDTRRYYVDRKTGYPLRMETSSPEGSKRTIYDTREIQFPSEIDPERFEMKPVGGARVLSYDPPQSLKAPDAKRKLGFAPILPPNLPMGFKVQDMQLTTSDRWRALAVRISDGLVKATVYQWLSSNDVKIRSMEMGSSGTVGDVRLLVVSEMSNDIRRDLLRAFTRSGEIGTLQPAGWCFQPIDPAQDLVLTGWEPYFSPMQLTVLTAIKSHSGSAICAGP